MTMTTTKQTPMRRRREWSREMPDRSGEFAYVDLVRGPNDPERRQRGREAGDVAPHLTLAKTRTADWRRLILEHLNDGKPRTLNRIAVEMIDKTADVVFGSPFHDALWELVAIGHVEYTPTSPVYFRAII